MESDKLSGGGHSFKVIEQGGALFKPDAPTPELTRRERAAFYQIGEDNDEGHAIERSG